MDIRDRATLEAGRLRVLFERRGDRIAHRIVWVDGEAEQPLLASVEGSPEQDWPPSPALQEGRIETSSGRSVAMLVGMAGKSHWSMSVEADTEANQLTFDVACRVKKPDAELQSTYRALVEAAGTPGSNPSLILGNLVEFLPSSGVALAAATAELVLRAAISMPRLPTTARWSYVLRPN